MKADFSPQEIIQMALNIEEDGVQFYRAAADQTFEPNLKELFLQLACEEELHKDVIRKIADELGAAADQYEDEDAFTYVHWLVHGRVFPESADGSAQTPRELLSQAIEREKRTLLFYYDLKDTTGARAQEALNRLIEEEKQHVVKLSQQFKEL